MTDQTSTNSSEPTTNEQLGVIGAQAAQFEAPRNQGAEQSTVVTREDNLKLEALRLASALGESPTDSVTRARQYLEFLKGNDNG